MLWDWLPWRRRVRKAEKAGSAAEAVQEAEHQCAVKRILDAAQHNERDPGDGRPGWDGPTRRLLVAPLLTPGQVARSRQSGRW